MIFLFNISATYERNKIPRREVATYLKTDTAFVSKFEKGERQVL